jgi:hypothetical protein
MPRFQLRGREGLELFEGAVNLPRQPYLRTKHEKAAALFRSLIKNHPLVDGNKRVAVVALDIFLTVNGVDLKMGPGDMVEMALGIANYPGNFPPAWIIKWVRGGCVGRPRNIVSIIAEEWPVTRQQLLYDARTRDLEENRGPRVPGRRVRLSRAFWDEVKRIEREPVRQLQLGLEP